MKKFIFDINKDSPGNSSKIYSSMLTVGLLGLEMVFIEDDLSNAYANGMKKLIDVFQTLYKYLG